MINIFIIIIITILRSKAASSRLRSFRNTSLLTLWVHTSKARFRVLCLQLLLTSSSLCSLHCPDLEFEGIWVSDCSFLLVDKSENSENVVKSQDTEILCILFPPSDLFINHVLDIFWHFKIIHLRLELGWVIQIKLSHVSIDVFINISILQHHLNFPLTSHLVHYVGDNFRAEDELSSVSKSKVNNDSFDHIELI